MKDPILFLAASISVLGGFIWSFAVFTSHPVSVEVPSATQVPVATTTLTATSVASATPNWDGKTELVQRDRRWDLCLAAHGIPAMTFSNKINGGLLYLDPRAVIPLEGNKP